MRQLSDDDADAAAAGATDAREILAAIASASGVYRDAVVTVDILGLSYREAATVLDTSEATLTTRLHRGRKHAASQLVNEPTPVR
jgi:RNA polymerase sigma-70 factor (ECF subfamily)